MIKKKRQGSNNNIKFYDEECVNIRKDLRYKFKKWRNDNEEGSRLEYVETKKQYRILLNKKKEIYYNKEGEKINELLKDNNRKNFEIQGVNDIDCQKNSAER